MGHLVGTNPFKEEDNLTKLEDTPSGLTGIYSPGLFLVFYIKILLF